MHGITYCLLRQASGRTPGRVARYPLVRCGFRGIAGSRACRRVACVLTCECTYQTTITVSVTQRSRAVVTAPPVESAAHAGTGARHVRPRLGKWWSVEIQARCRIGAVDLPFSESTPSRRTAQRPAPFLH